MFLKEIDCNLDFNPGYGAASGKIQEQYKSALIILWLCMPSGYSLCLLYINYRTGVLPIIPVCPCEMNIIRWPHLGYLATELRCTSISFSMSIWSRRSHFQEILSEIPSLSRVVIMITFWPCDLLLQGNHSSAFSWGNNHGYPSEIGSSNLWWPRCY